MLYSKTKSGDMSGLSDRDRETIRSMGRDKLREYAGTKHSGLPRKVVEKVAEYIKSASIGTLATGIKSFAPKIMAGIKPAIGKAIGFAKSPMMGKTLRVGGAVTVVNRSLNSPKLNPRIFTPPSMSQVSRGAGIKTPNISNMSQFNIKTPNISNMSQFNPKV